MPDKPVERKVARMLQKKFNIPYTQALRCFRDTRELPGFNQHVELIKNRYQMSTKEAMFEVCSQEWLFE